MLRKIKFKKLKKIIAPIEKNSKFAHRKKLNNHE